MAAFRLVGTLLQNNGWTCFLTEAGVASSGTADSYLSASSVTTTRIMHGFTARCLYTLRQEASMHHLQVYTNLDIKRR